MQKSDITKTIIKVEYTYKERKGAVKTASFPVNLQRWIQMNPDRQEQYVAQHTKNKVITYNIL